MSQTLKNPISHFSGTVFVLSFYEIDIKVMSLKITDVFL